MAANERNVENAGSGDDDEGTRMERRLAEKWEDKEEILQDADEDGEQDREARRLR